jgi:hypothetical protein
MAQAFGPQGRPQSGTSAWGDVGYWLTLVATFTSGVFVSSVYRSSQLPHEYSLLFIALAALSLGFGAGILIYHLRQRSEAEWLRAEYDELGKRAEILVNAAEQLERRQPPGR